MPLANYYFINVGYNWQPVVLLSSLRNRRRLPPSPPLKPGTATNRQGSGPGPLRFHAAMADKLAVLAVWPKK